MKRFWLVLLSLALIVAFSTAAMAVDVKFSGEYYAAGLYLDKTSFNKDRYQTAASVAAVPGTAAAGYTDYRAAVAAQYQEANISTAFYYQRLRLNAVFVAAPGLMLTTRADIMERAWGANRSAATSATYNRGNGVITTASAPLDTLSAGTAAENENIAFDLVYLTYVSPIGIFTAGYQIDGAWGTVFGDNSLPTPKITYTFVTGGFSAGVQMGKIPGGENSVTAKNATVTTADTDNNFYTAFVNYAWKTGTAGILFKFYDVRQTRPLTFKGQYLATLPYAKAKLGPVDVQTELIWVYGKARLYEDPTSAEDVTKNALAAWIDATANFGIAYVGGTFAYMSGQDPNNTGSMSTATTPGIDWNPCLILFNSDLAYWAGNPTGNAGWSNAWFFQARGGVRPIDKIDIGLSVSYANAVVKPSNAWLYNDYGWEVDLTATYKITNNLSYMLGGGYLFTGKYYKATNDAMELQNDFLVLNKLTLTF